MTPATSRRAFLRGHFDAKAVMRPFGALPEMSFQDACTGCGDCIKACPEAILCADNGGYPYVDMSQNGCSFCGDCVEACDVSALSHSQEWNWNAEIASTCLSSNGVECRSCQDHCDERAIRFRPALGGRPNLTFDPSLCTGCGYCVAPCPVNAISLTKFTPAMEASSC